MNEPVRFTTTQETRGITVIDGPGGGKTSLIDHVLKNHAALQPCASDDHPRFLSVRVPSPATLKSLGLEILRASGYADISERRERWSIWDLVRRRLTLLGVAVLWIDEAHDLFGTSKPETNNILKTLKVLMQGPDSVIIVMSGVEELWELARTDSQVQRRFTKLELPKVSEATDGPQIARLLSSYCEMAELGQPQSADIVSRLIHASRGRFGRCIEGIINAIENALNNRQSFLDIQNFVRAYGMAEGCDPSRNIYLADNWPEIDPDGDIDDVRMQFTTSKNRKKMK